MCNRDYTSSYLNAQGQVGVYCGLGASFAWSTGKRSSGIPHAREGEPQLQVSRVQAGYSGLDPMEDTESRCGIRAGGAV